MAEVGEDHLESTRLALRLPETQLQEFRDRLQDLLDDYARRPLDPSAPRWSLYVGMHPEA